MGTKELIGSLLSTPLVVGCEGGKFTFNPGDVDCLMANLRTGRTVKLSANYTCPTVLAGNTLLAQTITLGLNLRLDPDLAGLTITPFWDDYAKKYYFWSAQSTLCKGMEGIAEPIGEWMPFELPATVLTAGSLNVEDLMDMANQALCGSTAIPLGDIVKALGAINDGFDECRFLSTVPPMEPSSALIGGLESSLLKVYPNPFGNTVNFEFVSGRDASARLEIFNALGQKITTLMDRMVEEGVMNRIQYQPVSQPGLLFYRFTLDTQVFNGKLIYNP
jgi:hypothetical protein